MDGDLDDEIVDIDELNRDDELINLLAAGARKLCQGEDALFDLLVQWRDRVISIPEPGVP